MIDTRVNELLEARGRSFYWLAKQTGISHTTLWRLKKAKALGINFDTLDKLCLVLECQPGDVLSHTNGIKPRKRSAPKRRRRTSKSHPDMQYKGYQGK
jgi:putative transcriptional regulator